MPKVITLLNGCVLLASVVVVCVQVFRGVVQWNRNNQSPVITVQASVIAKRADGEEDSLAEQNHFPQPALPQYFVSFSLDGREMELMVPEAHYEALSIGDDGELTHQGTRFLGWEQSGTSSKR